MKDLLKSLAGCLFLSLFLVSCFSSQEEKIAVFTGQEMTIDYRILIGHSLSQEHEKLITQTIRQTFDEVNQLYNKWNPQSELSQLNQSKAGIWHPLSNQLEKLLVLTDKIVLLTEGYFDPTIEPLQSLWKHYLTQGKIPSFEEIQLIAPAIGWNHIHFKQGFFYKDHDATSLDLGGIAKGYCVDLLVERLNTMGYENVFVEWGGEIRASGEHPDHRPWNIFITHFENLDPQQAIAILSLHNQAIATSGDYLQKWTIHKEGETLTYFHVIDARKLQPVTITLDSVASASVLGKSCAFVDGLATAAMMFPSVKESQEWANRVKAQFPELSFWIVSRG